MESEMDKIIVFGKGGAGKSTFASNLTMCFAAMSLRVLHVGCDPKGDSTMYLTDNPAGGTVMDFIMTNRDQGDISGLIASGRNGVKCVESGGPEAGIGCGGRGVARAIEFLEAHGVFSAREYDVMLFDVLGDVVCGGFAAPLRRGVGDKVVILVGEDEMSYYAANNIAKAVVRYGSNGIALAGLVVNRRDRGGAMLPAERFARLINTGIIGELPFSEGIGDARVRRRTVFEHDSDDPYSRAVAAIADRLLTIDKTTLPVPAPMDSRVFIGMTHGDYEPLAAPEKPVASEPSDETTPARKLQKVLDLAREGAALTGLRVLDGGEISLVVESPKFGQLKIMLAPAGAKDAVASARGFSIVLESGNLTTPAVRAVRRVSHVLGSFSIDEIRRQFCEEDTQPAVIAETAKPRWFSEKRAEQRAAEWRRFMAPEVFRRNIMQFIKYDVPIVSIVFGDLECKYATPPLRSDVFNAYNYPWLRHTLERESLQVPENYSRQYEVMLEENDIVFGAGQRLAKLAGEVAQSAGSECLFMINNTCVPVVAGEDVPSVVTKINRETDKTVLYVGAENACGTDPLVHYMNNIRDKRGFARCEKTGRAVNLMGFMPGAGLDEIKALLGALGIGVNMEIVPGISPSIYDRYMRAELGVFMPSALFEGVYKTLLADVPLPSVTPVAPYGVAATGEWLSAVAGALGMSDRAGEALGAAWALLRDEWASNFRQARDFRLGFVFDAKSFGDFSDPGNTCGIAVFDVLREMGFGIEVLYYTEAGQELPETAGMTPFSTPGELAAALAASPCRCFYSDFAFDERLMSAGKAQFSLQFFEMGLAGALRTQSRLISLCEMPFFGKYGKYL